MSTIEIANTRDNMVNIQNDEQEYYRPIVYYNGNENTNGMFEIDSFC